MTVSERKSINEFIIRGEGKKGKVFRFQIYDLLLPLLYRKTLTDPEKMSTTRLKRKHRKNIARANNKQTVIKQLLLTPVLKNVDIEELKAKFPTKDGAASRVSSAKEAATSTIDKVKEVAAEVVDTVSHSEVVEKAKEVVGDIVEKVQSVVGGNDTASENAESFNDAEAVTKPVNEDSQEGEHPKPEIAL